MHGLPLTRTVAKKVDSSLDTSFAHSACGIKPIIHDAYSRKVVHQIDVPLVCTKLNSTQGKQHVTQINSPHMLVIFCHNF